MASSKFLVVFALFFTCLSLANSENFKSKGWEQTEIVNLNDETDVKEPEQYGGGYSTGRCSYGCCYGEGTAASAAVVTQTMKLTVWGCRNAAATKSQRKLMRKLLPFGLRASLEKRS